MPRTNFIHLLARALLRLYPPSFRREHGDEFVGDLERRAQEPAHRGLLGRLRFTRLLLADLARGLATTWVRVTRRRGTTDPTTAAEPARRLASAPRTTRTTTMTTTGRPTMHPASILHALRHAARSHLRRPGFFAATTLTLAVGIGATSTIFSVADAVALRPLPYPEPERLVEVGTWYEGRDGPGPSSAPNFEDWTALATSLEHAAASRISGLTLLGEGGATDLLAAGVSASFFDVLGVRPTLGRGFTADDDLPGAEPVAILRHGLWMRRFDGDREVLGRALDFREGRFRVIGVMPEGFHPPEAIHHGDVELWFPLPHVSDDLDDRSSGFLQGIARVREGVTLDDARRDLDAAGRALLERHPDIAPDRPILAPLHERTTAGSGDALVLLLAATGFLLLLACANVANLFLVRATERVREMGLRRALGAGTDRLVGQLLAESLVVAAAAGALGLLLTRAGIAAFRAWNPGDLPRLGEVGLDPRVVAFAVGLAALTGIVFGLVPALRARRVDPAGALREGAGGVGATGGSAGRGRALTRNVLVAAQTATAVVLLVGAGVLVRSVLNLRAVEPGFEPEGAAWIHVFIDGESYPEPENRVAFFTELERRFEALPGVAAVGGTENLPMGRNATVGTVSHEGMQLAPDEDPPGVSYHRITPGFFAALGTPLLRGRAFDQADRLEGEPVAIVNQSLAERFWPGENPLGQRVAFGRPDAEGPWLTVVGVVADLRQDGLAQASKPELYIPWLQTPRTGLALVVRARGSGGHAGSAGIGQSAGSARSDADHADAEALLATLRAELGRFAPTVPARRAGTLERHVRDSIVETRFYTMLVSVFAGIALLLAAVGLYGSVAYTVRQRSREMGIRLALGSGRGRVLRMVIGQGMAVTVVGLALGIAGAYATSGLLTRFVFGTSPTSPSTLLLTSACLLAVAFAASWVPARRATRMDPIRTLREE